MPPGVDLHTFHPCDQPKSRAQLGVAQDAQMILFVGRIQPLKAPDVLIRAVAELAGRDPGRRERLRLIIIGSPSGPDSAWSPDPAPLAAELGVGDLVDFRPHSDAHRAVPLVLRLRRGRRAVLQRVVRSGRPGGAGLRPAGGGHRRRRAAARPYATRQTGLLVPGARAWPWADALGRRAGRRRRSGSGWGPNAAAHASTFSWDNTAAATLRAYARAIDAHRSRTLDDQGSDAEPR